MIPPSLQSEAEDLCSTARWCYARGWVPATSGNFSVCDRRDARMLISPSGLDKGTMMPGHLLLADMDGRILNSSAKPSAETALHLQLYRHRPQAAAVVHVHSIWNTLLSAHYAGLGYVPIQDYELLKGLSGVSSHEHREQIPILPNTQNYGQLSENFGMALQQSPDAHGVLLSAHGLYTWGVSVAEARRHLEALEFLFEVEGRRLYSTRPAGRGEP